MLMKKIKLFFTVLAAMISVLAYGQNVTVSGTVSDEANGQPVPFAAIQLKGTATGTSTDADGNYTITVPSSGTLVFSSVGYVAKEISVNGKVVLNVALQPDNEFLDETIVVAFGKSTKSSFTGSAAVVNSETLSRTQATSVTSALAGAVAGVQLTSSNGAPGASSTIRIRGFSSINAGKDPLIIVDGAPYSGDIANLNQADIESMTVLKDAASSALYGARGANGVIIITTKRAKAGDAVVTFEAKYGINNRALQQYNIISDPAMYYETHYAAVKNYHVASGMSELQAYQTANANLGKTQGDGGLGYIVYTIPQGQTLIGKNGKLNPNATLGRVVSAGGQDYLLTPDDWAAEGYRTGVRKEYNFSAAGSTDKSNFFASLAYLSNQGITDASDLTRYTARLRADYQAKKWLKIGANMSYSYFDGNTLGNNGSSTSSGNVWAFTSQTAPIYPIWVRDGNGNVIVDNNGIKVMDYGNGVAARGGVPGSSRPFVSDANPIQDSRLNTRNYNGNSFTASGFADVTLLPGLVFTTNATVFVDETRTTRVYNPYYGQFRSTKGTVEKDHSRAQTLNLQQLLNYNVTFGAAHNLGIMIGHEWYDSQSFSLGASKSNMFSQKNKELSGAVVDGQSAYSSRGEYNNEGYFSRIQYDYDGRYFVSASFRRDASSRFHPDYRWGNFWSLGGAWLIQKESWFNAPWVDELKFKASIGSQGNDNIGSYRYTDTFDITNSAGEIGTSFSSKGTRDITWETNTNFNAGIEFSVFKRLSGSFEYFNRKTTDMLFSFAVAPSLGYSSYYDNVGDLYNRGFELDLHYNVVNTKNFGLDVNANLTYLKNRITKLHEDKKSSAQWDVDGNRIEGYTSGSFFIAEDLSLYTWSLKEFAGVDPETGKSLWYKNVYVKNDKGEDALDEKNFKTLDKRETTDDYSKADYYVTKQTTIAPVYGGFGTSIRFYGFDFSANFSYQIGGQQFDGTYQQFMSNPTTNSAGYNFHVDVLKAWTPESKESDVPRWNFNDIYAAGSSTRFLTKAHYLNIENINFGYTLPSRLTQKVDIAALRLFVTANNVWYFAARQGFDPRQSYSGSTNATNYSPMRTISGGVTIKF